MAEAPEPVMPTAGRRLETPTRDRLFELYADTEALSRNLLFAEIAVIAAACFWVLLGPTSIAGPWPWISAAVGGFGVFRWVLHHWFLNSKRLADIRPDARFGVHTRDSLLALVQRVFAKLELPANAAPVFMTRAKDVNAHALRCELLPGLHAFNGVFLNRAIIHLLDEPELESVVGHELGHVFPYAPLLSRCYLLHAACAAAVSFAFAATFNTSAAVLLAPFAMLWILDWVIAFPHLRLSRGIEFLCDDFGAQAAGLIPALSSEFKIGAESEARQQILAHLLDATGRGKTIDPSELMEVYESAVPFGRSDPTAARLEIERLSASRGQADRRTSLGGFIRYLGERGDSGDQQEAIGEELARLKVVSELPLVPLDREPYLHGSAGWTMDNAARLTRTLEEHPHAVLFRQAEELTDEFTTHPNVSRRILFLWRNRSV